MNEEGRAIVIEAVELFKNSLKFIEEYVKGWHNGKVQCIKANLEVKINWTFTALFTGNPDHLMVNPLVLVGQDPEVSRGTKAVEINPLVDAVMSSRKGVLDGDH